MTPFRRCISMLRYGFFTCLMLVGMMYAAFLVYLWRHPPESVPATTPKIRHVPREVERHLGFVTTERASSFTRFVKEKPPEVVRIGCFGDSFTYCAEVGEQSDYPSMLQQLFRDHGHDRVEVLNFGVNAYGFNQTYLMWDKVARGFDLDYVVLGPAGFQTSRMNSFSYSEQFEAAHSRFVLDGDDVRLVEPVGMTPRQRVAAWRRFIPPLRYLRYERTTPLILKALLPSGRDFPVNPFYYYKGSLDDEAGALIRRLVGKILDTGIPVIALHDGDHLTQWLGDMERANLMLVDDCIHGMGNRFPYFMRFGHLGPSMNRLLAQILYTLLTGGTHDRLPVVVEDQILRSGVPGAKPLWEYSEVGIGWRDRILGRFVGFDASTISPVPVNFSGKGVAALLSLPSINTSLVESLWLPFEGICREGGKVELEVAFPSHVVHFQYGVVTHVAGGVLFCLVPGADWRIRQGVEIWPSIFQRDNDFFQMIELFSHEVPAGLTMRFQDRVVATADMTFKGPEPEPPYRTIYRALLQPAQGTCIRLFAAREGKLEPADMGERGEWDLMLKDDEAGWSRFPIATWRREWIPFPGTRGVIPSIAPAVHTER
ncbi:SGNH/GDSL hydrolase family protein [bacterium]|nr:SGNH/GDSL hydrolase family protein [candidate division CSSED10-310 bacterium]